MNIQRNLYIKRGTGYEKNLIGQLVSQPSRSEIMVQGENQYWATLSENVVQGEPWGTSRYQYSTVQSLIRIYTKRPQNGFVKLIQPSQPLDCDGIGIVRIKCVIYFCPNYQWMAGGGSTSINNPISHGGHSDPRNFQSLCSSPTFSTYKPLLSFPRNLTKINCVPPKATVNKTISDYVLNTHWRPLQTTVFSGFVSTGVFTVKIHGQVTAGCLNILVWPAIYQWETTLPCNLSGVTVHRRVTIWGHWQQLQQLGVACFKNCTDCRRFKVNTLQSRSWQF